MIRGNRCAARVRVLAGLLATSCGVLVPCDGSAQSRGRLFNPQASPSQADLVAFERLEGDSRLIHFARLSDGSQFPLSDAGGEAVDILSFGGDRAPVTRFSGDLAWRPGIDRQGRQWFSYVAGNGQGGLDVYLHFFRGGRLGNDDPIQIAVAGSPSTPSWSFDGRSLAFVEDGSLKLVSDVRAVLQGEAERPAITTIPTTGLAAEPTWSPTDRRLAYSIQTGSGGSQDQGIEVIDVESGRDPVGLTRRLTESDEFRPSWSHDGRYVAFYVDRAAAGGEVDIGVAEVQEDQSGLVFRGEFLGGRSPRIALDVLPNEIVGPAWTLVESGGEPSPAVVYVLKDEERNYPVAIAGLQAWLGLSPREEFEISISESARWGTVQNKFVTSNLRDGAIRFVYVSQVGGGEQLQLQTYEAEWVPRPSLACFDCGGSGSVAKALVPGLNQLGTGQTKKGVALASLGAASAAAWGLFLVDLSDKRSIAVDAAGPDGMLLRSSEAYQDWESSRNRVYMAGAAFGAVWLYSLLDATVLGGGGASTFDFSVVPSTRPYAQWAASVDFRLTLPGSWWP